MINLVRLPTPEEKRLESIRQMEEVMIAEEAQAMGGTVEEVKRRHEDNYKKNELTQSLVKAIKQKDDVAVAKLIHELKDDPKRLSNIFVNAANANNEYAFRTLLETGIPCDYSSHPGAQAFMAAISSETPIFLSLLLEKQCNYIPHSESDSLGKRIVQSRYPEKIFQISENLIDSKYRDEALLKAINKKMSQQVLTMLDLDANPNAVSKRRNMGALSLSLRNNMPKVAMHLIQKGAMIETEHLVGRFEVLSWAIMHGYLDIAQEVVKRYPDYIRRKSLGQSALKAAFFLKDTKQQTKALKFLHSSIEQSEFDEVFLNDIIRYRKSKIALAMLDLGVNPNAFSKSANASALFLSLQKSMPDVAMHLIQQGAGIGVEDLSNGQYDVLSTAIKKGYLDVAREMLRRNPNYIQREGLSQTVLTAALYALKDMELRREAVTLLLKHGVEPSKTKNGGIRWLIQTVELQDPILVRQLLNSGIDPNIRSKMRLALGVAKAINNRKAFGVAKPETSANKNEIIAILKQNGATDDLLAIVRKEKGIDLDVNCRVGRLVSIDTKAIVEKYAQHIQNNSATNSMGKNDLISCVVATANCANQGYGADDCMRSVQTCDATEAEQSLCCTNKLKQRYFEARCSQLDVSESKRWMMGAVSEQKLSY
jgi:ankyrin repeat protein